ncbi:uncharacterized protein YbjT (DUF2867 family) [Psychromicrobium silvestre]|uniref:Uncharacterized protein YbjT (DUF2867 family) n=1 Tax=Psychromicrobium silvestre TaxID=1645614 RepID=A0A7Y9LT99_9MICC|nr:NAD(P)H-binding protein [Psychromicrobium silvestre]NYE95173.1 uncharacterized protein YbjT (DUF2867 family) [Psychromicrobium silvestre]
MPLLIAVAGGTGTAGRAVVAEALSRGHQVRVISRHLPGQTVDGVSYAVADAATGVGLAEAVSGVDVVVDTMDAKFGKALKTLPAASERLREAAHDAGVQRTVLLSILNCEQSDYGYYRAQAARAAMYLHPAWSGSVVYATQFHQLIASILGAVPGLIPVFPGVSFQPISVQAVATALVDAASVDAVSVDAASADAASADAASADAASVDAAETGARLTRIAGPEVLEMSELTQLWKAAGHRGARVRVPLPGAFGDFLRAGKNLAPDAAVPGPSFAEWLAS